jgi:ATP-dependent DNA helicase RecQ
MSYSPHLHAPTSLTSPGDPVASRLREVLRRYWGYESLRPLQAEAMHRVMAGKDSLVVIPTGGGKSLCYQLPALCRDGLALVVSPLISLMKDQVDRIRQHGIPAAYVNSTLSLNERQRVAEQIRRRELKLLYVAPERLLAGNTLSFLRSADLSLIAIDEAHCISSWGHDFRPEYRGLGVLKQQFPHLGVHAYTATADPRIRRDIAEQLRLVDPAILVGNFDRPNLTYRVVPVQGRFGQICEVIDRHPGQSGIIYCIGRKEVEQLAASLSTLGYCAAPYHAGLSPQVRKQNQEAFLQEEIRIIVATVAFGMGIDKPNVRFVLHARMPKSLEHYQQESGRAGRDGLPAECLLLYGRGDIVTWKRMLEDESPAAHRASLKSLQAMIRYCERATCRHAAIVQHFGQRLERGNCGACDYCLGEVGGGIARQRNATGVVRPEAIAGSTDSLQTGSPPGTSQANSKRIAMSSIPALKLFRKGADVEEVSKQLRRARSTTMGYLLDYIHTDKIHDWTRWVAPEVGAQVEAAMSSVAGDRLKPVFEKLQGKVDYDTIRVVKACVENRPAPAADSGSCTAESE